MVVKQMLGSWRALPWLQVGTGRCRGAAGAAIGRGHGWGGSTNRKRKARRRCCSQKDLTSIDSPGEALWGPLRDPQCSAGSQWFCDTRDVWFLAKQAQRSLCRMAVKMSFNYIIHISQSCAMVTLVS